MRKEPTADTDPEADLWSTPQIFRKKYVVDHTYSDKDVMIVEDLDEMSDTPIEGMSTSVVSTVATMGFVSAFIDTLNTLLPEELYIRVMIFFGISMLSFVLVAMFTPNLSITKVSVKMKEYRISLNKYIYRQFRRSFITNFVHNIPPFFCWYVVDGLLKLIMPHMDAKGIFWRWTSRSVVFVLYLIFQMMNVTRRSREAFRTAAQDVALKRKQAEESKMSQVVIIQDHERGIRRTPSIVNTDDSAETEAPKAAPKLVGVETVAAAKDENGSSF